jgi:hypothetical protein
VTVYILNRFLKLCRTYTNIKINVLIHSFWAAGNIQFFNCEIIIWTLESRTMPVIELVCIELKRATLGWLECCSNHGIDLQQVGNALFNFILFLLFFFFYEVLILF